MAPCWGPWFCRAAGSGVRIRMKQSGAPQGSVLAPLVLQSSRCACRDEAGKSGVSYGSMLGPLVLQSSRPDGTVSSRSSPPLLEGLYIWPGNASGSPRRSLSVPGEKEAWGGWAPDKNGWTCYYVL